MARKVWDDATGKHVKKPPTQVDIFEPLVPAFDPAALEIVCPSCNAKPGEQCASITTAAHTRDVPHAARLKAARSQQP
jgi:hypothetical protein